MISKTVVFGLPSPSYSLARQFDEVARESPSRTGVPVAAEIRLLFGDGNNF